MGNSVEAVPTPTEIVSLTKNSQTFHKLPNGKYGLREWYPAVKDKKPGSGEEKEAVKSPDLDDDFKFEEKEKEMEAERAPKPNTAAKATA